jgi:Na+/H+ antiporter NhaD/arsenite permease-like protein
MRPAVFSAAGSLSALLPATALAADAHGLDGAKLSLAWGGPFVGLLLSIAILPLAASAFWHRHYGKVAAFWALALLLPLAAIHGFEAALYSVLHAALIEYLPFIVLLFSLFTIAGGILVKGDLPGTPGVNTSILAVGTFFASVVGTTGASMILIRPILRANAKRPFNIHVAIFFIFLVSNIGGALSPLGDPPLFNGFLRGIDFFWTTIHLAAPTFFTAFVLLAIFYALDHWFMRRENRIRKTKFGAIRILGSVNFLLLLGVITAILFSAVWTPDVSFSIFGVTLELQILASNMALLILAGLSLWLTPDTHRAANGFSWEPIAEVAKLFAGIFVTIIPVLAMLQAGRDGAFASLLQAVTAKDGSPHDAAYFWLTGALSAFLDNAPTYLVFFELTGGDAKALMGPLATTLAAISMGAVYMGALTYIGNAPNFMVKAIAEQAGVKMPGFFGYFGWACLFLLPVFALLTLIFTG